MRSLQVVRKTLANGSVKEYQYERRTKLHQQHPADSLGALLVAYQSSPEWIALSPITKSAATRHLAHMEPWLPHPVASVKRRSILTIRDAIASTRGPAAATGFVRRLSAIMTWAVSREWIENNPASAIKSLPGGVLRPWTAGEYLTAVARLPEPLRRAVVLARYTGQRRGDICALRWSAYDGASIRLTQQKTKVSLVVPVAPELRSELDVWKAEAGGDYILTTRRGVRWVGSYMTGYLGEELAKISPDFVGLNVHGLRKLCAVSLAEAGCSAHEIAAITGHKTLGMVQHYTLSVDQERLATAAIGRTKPTL